MQKRVTRLAALSSQNNRDMTRLILFGMTGLINKAKRSAYIQ